MAFLLNKAQITSKSISGRGIANDHYHYKSLLRITC